VTFSVSRKKWTDIYFSHNFDFDKFRCIVVIFWKEYHDGNAKLLTALVAEYRTRNREVAGSTHTQSTASNLEQVANLLCARPTQPTTLIVMGNEQ